MKVINLLGGPSSGKSTTAAGMFYFMKMKHMSVEYVPEVAKDYVYDGTLEMMLDRQEVLFAEQHQRLHRLRGKVDYAIMDSPLLLSCVYCDMNAIQKGTKLWPAVEAFKQFVVEVIQTYENINIFIDRPEQFEVEGRAHDLEQSLAIDNKILEVLNVYGFNYNRVSTTDTIANDLASLFDVKTQLN